jgi:hypothetical protein
MSREPAPADRLDERIEALIRGPQYAMSRAEKQDVLLPILRASCIEMGRRCAEYGRFLARLGGRPENWLALADLPALPVSAFKRFLLSAVAPERVVRELHSSATTGGTPSRIVIDKATAFRQGRALVSILKEHLGSRRRPYLVLDAAESAVSADHLGARGAAIRGVGHFASETTYAMDAAPGGKLVPAWDRIDAFFTRHADAAVLLFGFTAIVWTRLVLEAEAAGRRFRAPRATLLHSGGWKRLTDQAVSKEEFARRTAALFGCPATQVLDFYGMVEQVGTVFVDCPAGNKHAPAFAEVILRRPGSLEPVAAGETGLIEVLSALPASYPGHALLSEDQGLLVGCDDCPCGAHGVSFRFVSRVERAEPRGCGDVAA